MVFFYIKMAMCSVPGCSLVFVFVSCLSLLILLLSNGCTEASIYHIKGKLWFLFVIVTFFFLVVLSNQQCSTFLLVFPAMINWINTCIGTTLDIWPFLTKNKKVLVNKKTIVIPCKKKKERKRKKQNRIKLEFWG